MKPQIVVFVRYLAPSSTCIFECGTPSLSLSFLLLLKMEFKSPFITALYVDPKLILSALALSGPTGVPGSGTTGLEGLSNSDAVLSQ